MSVENLEKAVLRDLIFHPEIIKAEDFDVNYFPSINCKRAFHLISQKWETEQPAEISAPWLRDQMGGNGLGEFVGSLLSETQRFTIANFRQNLAELKKNFLLHRMASGLGPELECEIKTGTMNMDSIFADLDAYRALSRPVADVSGALRTGADIRKLDLRVNYLVDQILPEKSLTLLHGRGGSGKTYLSLQLALAISEGQKFYEYETCARKVVYCDFENSLPTLGERIEKLNINSVLFWHLSADPKPPKLDSEAWRQYFSLPAGAVIIVDSLRAVYDGDENSSQDVAVIMGRLKELREAGFTLLLIHHSPKGSDRVSKGSTAITDLADHVLALYKVRKSGSLEEVDDDRDIVAGDTLCLATREKTRYRPFHCFLQFSPESGGFVLAEDPDDDELRAIAEFIRTSGRAIQTEICAWARRELSIGKKARVVSLLKKGERKNLWTSNMDGTRRLYVTD